MGASLFVHDHISEPSHRVGPERRAPHDTDHRCRALPQNALEDAERVDTPVLLLVGCENGLRLDSQALCHDVLTIRQPQLDVPYTEVPHYGHLDTFIGRGAALDVFGHIPEPGTPGCLS